MLRRQRSPPSEGQWAYGSWSGKALLRRGAEGKAKERRLPEGPALLFVEWGSGSRWPFSLSQSSSLICRSADKSSFPPPRSREIQRLCRNAHRCTGGTFLAHPSVLRFNAAEPV